VLPLEDLLAGFSLELDDPALDRIDEIVPPGTDLVDLTWKPPALTDPALRRRLTGRRAAGERDTIVEKQATVSPARR
jgi:hypothetical protein